MWSYRAVSKPQNTGGECLRICTSRTLHHCMVNYIGASPELINKSPLSEGVIYPTCSARELYSYHESVGEFAWEPLSSISVWIFNGVCAGAQLYEGLSSQSAELLRNSAGATAVPSNAWLLAAISKMFVPKATITHLCLLRVCLNIFALNRVYVWEIAGTVQWGLNQGQGNCTWGCLQILISSSFQCKCCPKLIND